MRSMSVKEKKSVSHSTGTAGVLPTPLSTRAFPSYHLSSAVSFSQRVTHPVLQEGFQNLLLLGLRLGGGGDEQHTAHQLSPDETLLSSF